MKVPLKHERDTQNFAYFSSAEGDGAFRSGNPVIRAWVPFSYLPTIIPEWIDVELEEVADESGRSHA